MAEFIKSARDAEHAAARAMKTLGFSDAEATPVGPDAGIDVRSREALAQVKWKGGVASRPDLQRLYGACAGQHHKAMLFYSASGYSKSAVAYAAQVKIALFEYDPLGAVDPQNSIARGLVEKSRQSKSSERQGLAKSVAGLPRTAAETTEDPDLLRWMASTNFMSDPTSVPVQKPSLRDEYKNEYKKRAAEFKQNSSSNGTRLIDG